MADVRRWKVRGGKFGFVMPDGTVLGPGTLFSANDEEVKGQEYKLDLAPDETPEVLPRTGKARVRIDRMVHAAPENTVV